MERLRLRLRQQQLSWSVASSVKDEQVMHHLQSDPSLFKHTAEQRSGKQQQGSDHKCKARAHEKLETRRFAAAVVAVGVVEAQGLAPCLPEIQASCQSQAIEDKKERKERKRQEAKSVEGSNARTKKPRHLENPIQSDFHMQKRKRKRKKQREKVSAGQHDAQEPEFERTQKKKNSSVAKAGRYPQQKQKPSRCRFSRRSPSNM